jgi:hypothetical protein
MAWHGDGVGDGDQPALSLQGFNAWDRAQNLKGWLLT